MISRCKLCKGEGIKRGIVNPGVFGIKPFEATIRCSPCAGKGWLEKRAGEIKPYDHHTVKWTFEECRP